MSGLRPAITSIAELKKAIEKYAQLYFPKGAEDYGKGLKDGSRIALEKISEFEAGLRTRVRKLRKLYDDNDPESGIDELRKVLGEGVLGETECNHEEIVQGKQSIHCEYCLTCGRVLRILEEVGAGRNE